MTYHNTIFQGWPKKEHAGIAPSLQFTYWTYKTTLEAYKFHDQVVQDTVRITAEFFEQQGTSTKHVNFFVTYTLHTQTDTTNLV